MKKKKVGIIGAGASGIIAAIVAAREGATVTLLEHTGRIGKKILSTGNGKCNFTNEVQGLSCYRGNDPAFVLPGLEQFGAKETLSFFKEIGIYPKEKNGYYYPASEQAQSILDSLVMELSYQQVTVLTDCLITSIQVKQTPFHLKTSIGDFSFDSVVIATGLKSFSKSGSDGTFLPIIQKLGHRIEPIVPALVQLITDEKQMKMVSGIRMEITLSVYINQEFVICDTGEVQLTDYGISGIPTFQISRFCAKALFEQKKVTVVLDYFPKITKAKLHEELVYRFFENDRNKTVEEALCGLMNKKLIPFLLKTVQISTELSAKKITKTQCDQLLELLKHHPLQIKNTKGFDASQVCAGGVCTKELNPLTMESLLHPNLYFAGEVIDIDGICGGYNLQWAWTSGFLAGKNSGH